jgi:3',5'-cyclic AMP phosphodiesterase CpdA
MKSKAAHGLAALVACTFLAPSTVRAQTDTTGPVKIAFYGDQGLHRGARKVLNLVVSEKAELVVHLGDMGYAERDPESASWFEQLITRKLGAAFPYLVVAGNHDLHRWGGRHGYMAHAAARLRRVKGLACTGITGIRATCTYRGILIVLSGIGLRERDGRYRDDRVVRDPSGKEIPGAYNEGIYLGDLWKRLAGATQRWRICAWHKNNRRLQVGGKGSEVPLQAYDICRQHGAIVATAHEHSYSRTHLITRFHPSIIHAGPSKTLAIKPGQTFAFVSGLAGLSIRDRRQPCRSWWARSYVRSYRNGGRKCAETITGATYGALFCTFRAKGVANRAECYFKNVDGRIIDRFSLTAN